ncbi:MAG: hypothetical protein Q8Q14_15510 [Gemmatimonadales bacterium]|nr:hypothetical protein [Gemmatimonadales bacterium]
MSGLPLFEAAGLIVEAHRPEPAPRDESETEAGYTRLLDERVAVRSRLLVLARKGPDGQPRTLCRAGVLLRDHGDRARMESRRLLEAEPAGWVRIGGEVDELLARAGVPEGEQADLWSLG